MDKIIKSNVILETTFSLDKTFEDLQKLKEMGIADYRASILHNDGEFLPAGAYNDYETFAKCYHAMSRFEPGDDEASNDAIMQLMESFENMTEEEKLFARTGWTEFLKKQAERKSKEQINAQGGKVI